LQRPEEKSTGAGEETMGAAAGAIANAVFDATGVRFRQFPLRPERVKAALSAQTEQRARIAAEDGSNIRFTKPRR
jgi:nicotinate dehydrogenase subunit B